VSTRTPAVIPGPYPPVEAPPWEEPFDIAGHMAQSAQLREQLERAAARGDIGAAQQLHAELQAATARFEHHQQRLIGSQPPPPRGPEDGEEERLGKQLSSLAKRAQALEAKKKRILMAQADEAEPDFSEAADIDSELEELAYEKRGLEERQEEINAFHASREDYRKRMNLYRRSRMKAAAEKRRRAKLAKLAEAVMPQLKDIRDLARSCGDKEITERIIAMLRR
jgi:hypothetical protein